jgi:uncharacterized caspase-like protein
MSRLVSIFLALFVLLLTPLIASAGLALRVQEEPPEDKEAPKDLYVLSVGVDQCQDPNVPPQSFTSADASALATLLNERGAQLFRKVIVQEVKGVQATRAGIEAAFRKVSQSATPDDTFVFTYSGNAVVIGHESVYLFARDISDVQSVSDLTAHGVSASLLQVWCDQIQASRQLLLLDACDTAEVFDGFTRRAAAILPEERRLSHRTTLLFGSEGLAYENATLRHGVLSYAALQGLSGEADSGRQPDQVITVRELEAYLFSKVPQVSAAFSRRQEFRSYGRGGDFPLAAVPRPASREPDTVPPKVTLTSPQVLRGSESVLDESALEVAGRAEDDIEVREVLVNGKRAELSRNGDFQLSLELPLGMTEVEVVATDTSGNPSLKRTFTVRRDAPGSAPQAVPTRQGKDYALLIATNEYAEHEEPRWEKLSNPIFDAEALAEVLTHRYGFEPAVGKEMVRKNQTYREIFDLVRACQINPDGSKRHFNPDDQLFLFFAGHGTFDDTSGEGFLVAKDSLRRDETRNNYVVHSRLATWVDKIDCDHIFIVLDACFGGTFSERLARGSILPPSPQPFEDSRLEAQACGNAGGQRVTQAEFIRREMKRESRLFLTSGGKQYVPDGEPGHHSPFANALLEALEAGAGGDGVLTYHDVVGKLKREKLREEPQTGCFKNGLESGGFLFIAR